MKAIAVLTVARIVEIVDKPDIPKEDALQLAREEIQSNPFSFVDTGVAQDTTLDINVSIFEMPNG